jgi:hypothetical protein
MMVQLGGESRDAQLLKHNHSLFESPDRVTASKERETCVRRRTTLTLSAVLYSHTDIH